MSKVGQWVFEMQEDATWMTKEKFIQKYGASQASFWEKLQLEEDEDFLDSDPESVGC